MSIACDNSDGAVFLGKGCEAHGYVERMNRISDLICTMSQRAAAIRDAIYRRCPPEPGSSSSSSSSYECPLACDPRPILNIQYLLDFSKLLSTKQMDLWERLEIIEAHYCATYKQLIDLEAYVKLPCNPD